MERRVRYKSDYPVVYRGVHGKGGTSLALYGTYGQ